MTRSNGSSFTGWLTRLSSFEQHHIMFEPTSLDLNICWTTYRLPRTRFDS